jgi:hypothetical protein
MAERVKDRYSEEDPDRTVRPRRAHRGPRRGSLTLITPKVAPHWFDREKLDEEQFEYENRQLQKQAERFTDEEERRRKKRGPTTRDAAKALLEE